MEKRLPARPNLDHLRSQAKSLLAALGARDPDAIATILKHLPSAKGMTPAEILATPLRLADAQSAIARKSGFAAWPHLARHVEQLRALEGTWSFTSLEIDGNTIPPAALGSSRILIDGDRFRTESPEAIYEGIFNINVETHPHEIDIEFIAGPEAGNSNFGIFRLDADKLEICLDLNAKPRPKEFRTSSGSGHAYETLERSATSRPDSVTGGTPSARPPAPTPQACVGFDYIESSTLTKLQGQWSAVKTILDGQELPGFMVGTGLRSTTKNEIKISFGGQTMIHALVKLDESQDPIHIDYYNLGGAAKGTIQLGLFKWLGSEACFCMAAPDQPRPADFTPGHGRTYSQWKPKKK